jgi:NAD(P)H-dependent flavin oxidoreductase YrpB (nitropropane dioxygenase family)
VSVLDRLGIRVPVIAAGMGGGLSTADLTVAVGRAGGMGQIGIDSAAAVRASLDRHRAAADAGPVAVNLLLPFTRRAHHEAARTADAIITFWGTPRRPGDQVWIHQCGSVEEARAAVRAGADAVIAQGAEAGGHVRGSTPALTLTAQLCAALGPGVPVWTAGGIATREDVEAALAAGAEAVVVGTRLLMSAESAAHPGYKHRLLSADRTLVTELFGAGWPAPHRVVPNAATERWLRTDGTEPAWLSTLHRATAPVLSRTPVGLSRRIARVQRVHSPLLTPVAATADDPSTLLDAGPLYAGACVARIHDVRPAGEIVAELAGEPAGPASSTTSG